MNKLEAMILWGQIQFTSPSLDPVMRTIGNSDYVIILSEGTNRHPYYIWSKRDWIGYQATNTLVGKETSYEPA